MLSALSNINGTAHPVAAVRPQPDRTRTEAAVAALAALSPVQPVPSASDPFDNDRDAFSFLYGPNGQPSGVDAQTPAMASSTRPGASAPDSHDPESRLAMESTQMTALLSSLMSPSTATETSPAPTQQPPANASQPALHQSLISKLYQQF